MANEQNLISPEQRNLTSEEARRIGSLGGKASVKAKRKKKAIREIIEEMLSMNAPKKLSEEFARVYGFDPKDMTNKDTLILAQLNKAVVKKDTQAFTALLDRLEGKPQQTIDNTYGGNDVTIKVKAPKVVEEKESAEDN